MKSESNIVLYLIGGVVAAIIGIVIYNQYIKSQTATTTTTTTTDTTSDILDYVPEFSLMGNSSAVNPTAYFDVEVPAHAAMIDNYSIANRVLVQNEENIVWQDWLGRERVIKISRKVH